MNKQKVLENYTTPEQGEFLLRMGIPKTSADCYWGFTFDEKGERELNLRLIDANFTNELWLPIHGDACVPCWSIGQLLKIYAACVSTDAIILDVPAFQCNPVGAIIEKLIKAQFENRFDFKAVEEI